MKKVEWITVSDAKSFLDLIELNSVGLEKVKELYKCGKYDEAVEEYYIFAAEKFKGLTADLKEETTQEDIKDADMLLENKIRLIGYDYISAGDPIDWTFYPYGDKQWQSHLGYMYFPKALLLAYRETKDKKYIDKWNAIHMEFVKNHPYGNDGLFYSKRVPMYKNEYLPVCGGEGFCHDYLGGSWISLATSRIERWIDGLVFTAKNDMLDISVLCNLTASVILEHLPVMINNPRKGTPNQFIHVSNLLINIGISFWETKYAPAAYLLGMERLEEALGQYCILPDGTDLEQCSGYNSGLVDAFYKTYTNNGLKNNKRIEKLYKLVEKRCLYLSLIKDPLGLTPAMSKRQNKPENNKMEDVLKYSEMYPKSELLKKIYNAVINRSADKDMVLSVDFPYGGYSVMRDGWERNAYYLFMKYSRYAPGHKHEDSNSIVLTALGRRLLIDSGNYNYANDDESKIINDYMHSSSAHSTMDIDGLSQARGRMEHGMKLDERNPEATTNEIEYEKYLKIRKLHETECDGRRIHNDHFEMVEGVYEDGYFNKSTSEEFLEGKHVRRVIFVKGCGYVIDDIISADDRKEHEFFQHWNLAEEFAPEDVDICDNSITTHSKEGANIAIMNFSEEELSYKTAYGSMNPIGGWCATEYGHMIPSMNITACAKAKEKCRIISFVYPFEGEKCDINKRESEGLIEISVPQGSLEIKISDNGGIVSFDGNSFEF